MKTENTVKLLYRESGQVKARQASVFSYPF